MNIMQGVLILSTLLVVSVRSQNTVDSLFLQVSDMEDAGMIFAGSVAIKVSKGKSPEVPFHGITFPYSYFEFLRQFSKKQNMIKKKYHLKRNKKFVDKAQ